MKLYLYLGLAIIFVPLFGMSAFSKNEIDYEQWLKDNPQLEEQLFKSAVAKNLKSRQFVEWVNESRHKIFPEKYNPSLEINDQWTEDGYITWNEDYGSQAYLKEILRSDHLYYFPLGDCSYVIPPLFILDEESSEAGYYPDDLSVLSNVKSLLEFFGINNSLTASTKFFLDYHDPRVEKFGTVVDIDRIRDINSLFEHHFLSGQIASPVVIDLIQGDCADLPVGYVEAKVKIKQTSDYNQLEFLYFIPDFYYFLCKKTGKSAWDTKDCRFWIPIKEESYLTGHVRYIAVFENGKTKRGGININNGILKELEGRKVIDLTFN
ncbi:hypothetical protein K1718_00065 [Roseibium porphyridii]|uniref:Uncharacterized protein n=1 Tax=Roseibium porphyridii TaxID=2866279 RepID=A0ABY8F6T8_9HYPH|nr:hypothetical protein [Roseibium sp. KMA01]WFE89792.1 hypothetical protein K1718_00065 [Roseibium sp. KMA01]